MVAAVFAGSWRALWQRFRPVDRLTAGYTLAFAVGVVLLGRDQPRWWVWVLAHLLLLLAIVVVVGRWGERVKGASGFVRLLYPAMLYPLFYREAQIAVHWIFPGFLDHQIVALERAVFGVDPNVWLGPAQSVVVNELLMLGYFSYYLLLPVVALSLYVKGRSEELSALLHATTAAFVISYVGFALYPLEGPRYFLADRFSAPLAGWFIVPLVNWIVGNGAIHGGCMPSSHVAVALVVLVWAKRTQPRLAAVLAPLVLLLFAATVWGRFHYFSDVVAGWGVGIAALWLTRSRQTRSRRVPSGQTGIDRIASPALAERTS